MVGSHSVKPNLQAVQELTNLPYIVFLLGSIGHSSHARGDFPP